MHEHSYVEMPPLGPGPALDILAPKAKSHSGSPCGLAHLPILLGIPKEIDSLLYVYNSQADLQNALLLFFVFCFALLLWFLFNSPKGPL